ncbi:DUF397 domain-containing protein [Streptomyces sp. SID8370]|nr:DUF397 domain-containing protein [Streptomyces sp. SID8370]MYW87280.1 DUF397 domain-containing protein [Streptomyces sp. SID8371]
MPNAVQTSPWVRSSHCDAGACLEVGPGAATVAVRDSKDPRLPHVWFTLTTWRTFARWAGKG